MNVNDNSGQYAHLECAWDLIDALKGGTHAMRCAKTTYMPKRTLEEQADYDARLAQATLLPAFTETVDALTGRVFAEPITYEDSVPDWIKKEVVDDCDMQGRSLHVYAEHWFQNGLERGISFTLVESPPKNGAVTQADQRAAGLRPYYIHVDPRRILGWRETGGQLTQVRIAFERVEDDDAYGTKTVQQVRVYDRVSDVVTVTVHEETRGQDGKGTWGQVGKPVVLGVKRIPLIPFYAERVGFMQGTPPLRELAYLNAKHWSMQCSNDALIETASVPILCTIGIEGNDGIKIGAKSAVSLPLNGDMKFVEHTGQAIKAGRDALNDLKDEMRQAGAKLVEPKQNTKTATEAGEDATRENSDLASMARVMKDTLDDLLDLTAEWRGETDGGAVKIKPNLKPSVAPADTARIALEARRDGAISDETCFEALQMQGIVPEDAVWEDEQTRLQEQGPPEPVVVALPTRKPGQPNPPDPTQVAA